jgi:hypothetical protein
VSKKHTETASSETPEYPAIPERQESGVPPLIDGLKNKPTTHFPAENEVAPPDAGGLEPAELDQDPGGGYNPDGTYPQT